MLWQLKRKIFGSCTEKVLEHMIEKENCYEVDMPLGCSWVFLRCFLSVFVNCFHGKSADTYTWIGCILWGIWYYKKPDL